MIAVTRAWLYVRSNQSVRIVVDGGVVAVYGPGPQFNHSRFQDHMDAAIYQAAIEDALIRDGWTLECLTSERRSGGDRRANRRTDRQRRLRLVDPS